MSLGAKVEGRSEGCTELVRDDVVGFCGWCWDYAGWRGGVGLERWMWGGNGEVGGGDGVFGVWEVVMEGRGGGCCCLCS